MTCPVCQCIREDTMRNVVLMDEQNFGKYSSGATAHPKSINLTMWLDCGVLRSTR